MYNIKTLRGTIFSTPIRYGKKFVESLAGVVDGYMPMIFRDNGVLPIFPIWQLISPDEKVRLAFNGDKIDYVEEVESDVDDEVLKTFVKRCTEVLGKIMFVTEDKICTRVAFAPSVIVNATGDKPTELFSRLYKIQDFDGVQLHSSNISQVYRVNKNIEGKEITVNHVANFHAESELIPELGNNRFRERYVCDFDINTMVNPDNKFTVAGISAFFDMAPERFVHFYKLFFA